MSLVSIIIRTRNEADWIGHCLSSIKKQIHKNYEIIIVDNNSTDQTINIAKTYGINKIFNIKKFLPGKSLNFGCSKSQGKYFVFLSAHCIPENKYWLSNLISHFRNKKIAGVYGKQSPLKFSHFQNIRDLYITFGKEKKIQKVDDFFHNANSAIRKDIWKKIKFDEKLTNIEDRDWAKKVIKLGYNLIYDPDANVFHYHGIHHGTNPERLKKTINVIKQIEDIKYFNQLPETFHPNNIRLKVIIQFSYYKNNKVGEKVFQNLNKSLKLLKNKMDITFIKPKNFNKNKIPSNYEIINYNQKYNNLSYYLKLIINKSFKNSYFPDYVLYLNADFFIRPQNLLKDLLQEICAKGFDSLVPVVPLYNTNIFEEQKNISIVGDTLVNRDKKKPSYSTLNGLGCLVKSKIASEGKLISKNNFGLYFLNNKINTLRLSEFSQDQIKSFYNFIFDEK